MEVMRVVAAAVLLLVVVAVVAADEEDPPIPDIWKVVENSFDSHLTINLPDLPTGTTMLVDELYDISEEKGVVEVAARGSTTTNNYYSKTQQSFLVSDNHCSAGPVMEQNSYKMWGWVYDDSQSSAGKQNFVYGPSALLRIAKDFGDQTTYTKGVTVRDILADQWTINHPDGYILDYYFASDQWVMPYGHVLQGVDLKAPLLVTVYGLQGNPWNVEEPEFNQTVYYEYSHFKPYVTPDRNRKFLVREGVDCKNRETLDPDYLDPPDAPSQFQVFLETITRRRGADGAPSIFVFRSWLYYSNWVQLLRLDVNPGQDAQEPIAAYKSIHDYNTGIEYRIDLANGDCQMRALDEHQLGNQVGSGSIGGVIMADPDNLFHLDDKYMFNGFSETRGIKTTRWTAVRDDIYNEETGKNYKKVVVDYQFNSKAMQMEGEQEGATLPLRVDVTVYKDNNTNEVAYRDTLNLLHMQTSFQEYDFNPFHVGECMDLPTERTWLKITFAGNWMHGASQTPSKFKKLLLQYVKETTKSSYVRFPEVQLDHDLNDLVYATMLVLEPAPYHLQFKKLPDRKPKNSDTKYPIAMHDVDSCAYACLSYQKFVCKSFYKCKGDGKTCYLSNYKNSPGEDIDVSSPCPHYNKALVTNNNAVQKPNTEIEIILDEMIVTGKFKIEMEYTDDEGALQKEEYHALFVQNEIFSDDPVFIDFVRDDFYMVHRRGKLVNKYTDLKVSEASYAKCLTKCLGQISFECESFSYCYNKQDCMLTSKVVGDPLPNKDVVQQTDCVVVVRKHTNDYIQLEGLVYLGDPKATFTTLDTERCAYLCDNTTDFTCRSFDFCLDSLKCSLYDHHTADAPDTMFNTSKDCMHFSRNALVDFTKHANQRISGTRDKYITTTTPSACAQACEDDPDFGCNGFDYCKEKTEITCFLTQDHYSDDGTEISDSLVCDHYSRDYYEGKDRDTYSHSKKTNYIYGPGDMAGLGCSMIVISIGLTFAGVYAFNKYKK